MDSEEERNQTGNSYNGLSNLQTRALNDSMANLMNAGKVLALREALFYCIAKGLRAVKCESDSLQLIRALNEETPISEIYGIIADILNLVVAFDYVSFVWIPRSENKAADALAKQALSNASFVASSMNPRV